MLTIYSVEFHNKHNSAPFLTIHDAVLTTKEYATELNNIMFDQLYSITGIRPGIKLEEHSIEVIPSESIIEIVTDKIVRRAKKIKKLNNTTGIFDYNLAKTEKLIESFENKLKGQN